jgi:pimeloyl-ACP methyl ester carboxylesterase
MLKTLGVALLALGAWFAASPAMAAPLQKVAQVPFAGGSQTVLYVGPAAPSAIVINFPGGDGLVKIGADGTVGLGGNFVVRTRELWVQHGLGVVIPDVPDRYNVLYNRRNTAEYGDAIAKLVAFAKSQANVPVWLVGTSQGTNAAANGGSRLTHGEIAGVVLTSSLTRQGNRPNLLETVFDNDLAAIDVPVLIVSHKDDGCELSPPSDATRIKAALSRAPRSDIMLMSGGLPPKSRPCEARSAHGYFGVEAETIQRIADWMKAAR